MVVNRTRTLHGYSSDNAHNRLTTATILSRDTLHSRNGVVFEILVEDSPSHRDEKPLLNIHGHAEVLSCEEDNVSVDHHDGQFEVEQAKALAYL